MDESRLNGSFPTHRVELNEREQAVLRHMAAAEPVTPDRKRFTRDAIGRFLVSRDMWNGSDAPVAVAEGGGHLLRDLMRKGMVANVVKGMFKKPGQWAITDAGLIEAARLIAAAL